MLYIAICIEMSLYTHGLTTGILTKLKLVILYEVWGRWIPRFW